MEMRTLRNTIIDIKDLSDSREVMVRKAPKSILIFILIILIIVITLLLWSFFGEIDEYSTVSGEIRPQASTNIISAINGGKIKELNFENGDIVEAGDTILTLDTGSAESQKEALTTNIEEYKEKIKYNNQLKECVEKGENTFSQSNEEIEYYNQYEKYVNDLEVSLGQIYDTDNQNKNSKKEANVTLQSVQDSIDKDSKLIEEYNNIINAVENNLTFSSSNSMLISYYNNYIKSIDNADIQIKEYEHTYESLKQQIGNGVTQSQVDEVKVQLDSAMSQKESLKTAFLLEVNQKIDNLNTEIESLNATKEKTSVSLDSFSSSTSENQVKEQAKLNMIVSVDSTISTLENAKTEYEMQLLSVNETLENSVITAEISGQIVFYDELSVGNTVQVGVQIAKIMPSNNELRTILYIPNTEISDVKIGQKVEYMVSSISSTDYGKVYGEITDISADSFADESSGKIYYKAEATLESSSLTNLSGEIKELKSGMTVEAHIVSGSKKIIIWFLEQLNFID